MCGVINFSKFSEFDLGSRFMLPKLNRSFSLHFAIVLLDRFLLRWHWFVFCLTFLRLLFNTYMYIWLMVCLFVYFK